MNIFNIKPKEFRLVIILLLMFFFISAASITGSAIRDTLFLIKFDRNYLPLMYVAIAIVMAALIEAYKNYISDKSLHLLSLATKSSGVLTFSLLAFHNNLDGWIIPIFYIWIEVITILSVLQFWMICGEILNTRQAKRIFPIIIAGGSFSAIGSGFFIKPFVVNYGSENLLFITIIFLALSIIISQFLRPYLMTITHDKEESKTISKMENIRLDPYLKYIAIMVACSAFISRIIDYQFKITASNAFPLQNELVTFFGTYYILTGIATLVMQFFITSFILTKFGILAGLLFLPTTLIFGSLGFFIMGSLMTVLILKFSDQVFKFSMYNTVREILWLPLSRFKKNKSKPIIDGSLKSIVEGISGLTIFFLVTFRIIPDSDIYLLSLLAIILALYWFWNAFRIKKGYLLEIVNSIENRRLNFDKIHYDLTDLSTVNALNEALHDKDDFKKLFAINLLSNLPLEPWKKTIQNQFLTGTPNIQRKILELCWLKNNILTNAMIVNQIQLKNTISPYAISCASDRKINEHIQLIQPYINSNNISLKSSTLVAMFKNNKKYSKTINLINDILNNGKENEIINILEFLIKSNFDIQKKIVLNYLQSKNYKIKYGILRVISHNPKIDYLNSIILLLDDKKIAAEAKKTLFSYDNDIAYNKLAWHLSNNESKISLKISILGIIDKFDNKNLIQIILSKMNSPDLSILNACCNALNKISKIRSLRNNELNSIEDIIKNLSLKTFQLHLFKSEIISNPDAILLLDQISIEINIIEHLILKLGTLTDPTIPIESYLHYVDSKDPELFPLVLELVDSTFSQNTAKLIIPLLDSDINHIKIAKELLGDNALSKDEILKVWVESSHPWKTNISLQFLLMTKNKQVIEKIRWNKLNKELVDIKNFSNIEREYLDHIGYKNNFVNKEFNDMYSVLEKTLLLKSVNLFKNIPGEVLSKIAQITEEVKKDINEIIFNEGDHGDSLYIIISGKVSIASNKQSIAILGKGNCIGEMSILDQKPRSAGAITLEESILLKINQNGFYELMSSNPDIMKEIIMMLTKRLREVNKKITDSF